MCHSIWAKTLREHLVGAIVWGGGLGLFIGVTLAEAVEMGGPARQAAAVMAKTMPFRGEPVAVETPTGYATWHTVGLLPPILAIWAVLAGAHLIRSAEERGALDLLLAVPKARSRVFVEKMGGLFAASMLIAVLMGLGTTAGELVSDLAVDVGGALFASLNVTLTALIYGLLALVLAQLLARRAAAWVGTLIAAGYLLEATSRTSARLAWLGYLSPLYYHNLNKPLIAGYGVNVGALAVLVVADLVLAALALLLFRQRDIGGVALPGLRFPHVGPAPVGGLPALAAAGRSMFVRSIGLRALRAESTLILWWVVGVGVSTFWITALGRALKQYLADFLASAPAGMAALFGDMGLGTDTAYLSGVALFYLPVLTVLQALTVALAWVSDLDRGRVELVLATPQPRWRILLERFSSVLCGVVVVPLTSWAAMMGAAWLFGLDVDRGRFAIAHLGLVPLELLIGALAYALAGWLRLGGVAAICGFLVAVSYFTDILSPMLQLPGWVLDLSIFHQYGRPLMESPRWGVWVAFTFLAAIILAVGALRFQRAEVSVGS